MEIKIGNMIKLLRKRRGITQDELAVYLNVSGQSVSKWETGAANPDISFIPQLAGFFGVSIDTLFDCAENMADGEYRRLINGDASPVKMWEELHVKYPNDSRVEKELITALCSRNEVADFDKIFYHVVRLLRTRQEQNIEDKVLGALKGYILNAVQPKKEEEKFVHSGRKPADAAGKLPQREVDKIKDSYGVKYAKPKGKMVLVADDAAIIRIMVRKLLERKGFEVAEAEDGRQAVEKFDEIKPDFVVMDINMPEMDGITALSEIMKKADVPVIMLSAMCEIAYVNKAFGAGAVDFICKPFANDVFTERVTGLYK